MRDGGRALAGGVFLLLFFLLSPAYSAGSPGAPDVVEGLPTASASDLSDYWQTRYEKGWETTAPPSPVSSALQDAIEERAIGLFSPYNYAVIYPGTPIRLNISGPPGDVHHSLDGASWMELELPYELDTILWSEGTHRLEVWAGDYHVFKEFVFFIDRRAYWPPDTLRVDVVLIGFEFKPKDIRNSLQEVYDVSIARGNESGPLEEVEFRLDFYLHAPDSAYHRAFLADLRARATYRDSLQARLNLPALIDQRDTGTPRDIFEALVGWEIAAEDAEAYLSRFPPPTLPEAPGVRIYLMNLTDLDEPAVSDHWFVEPTRDPDTSVDQDWWRLEWDNDLNTPMGFPVNAWGGPNHTIYVDPTAYQWYADWTHVWWNGANDRAPYGIQYEEVQPIFRADYVAGWINDLTEGLVATLPFAPPTEPLGLVQNYVLSGSEAYTVDELTWIVQDAAFEAYLDDLLPFKDWEVNTTFASIDTYPELQAVVDANTQFDGSRGFIDALAVFQYLSEHREEYVALESDVFEILSVNFLYDNRSMVYAGREFTGLGGLGINAIFLKTDRLFYADGTRQKGLTSVLTHETGHNLGYGHQFGPNFRSDFIEGTMGYFRNYLGFGLFWEDALHRVYVREKLVDVLELLEAYPPLDLLPEFTAYAADYREWAFREAHADLDRVEEMLRDNIPPAAVAGSDLRVDEDKVVLLDGSGSSDNFRVVEYRWNFGDGTGANLPTPLAEKTWPHPGIYTVTLTVFDVAGNVATDTLVATVLDVTPPEIAITAPADGSLLDTRNVRITWTAFDTASALETMEVSLDAGPAVVLPPTARDHTFLGVSDGDHRVSLTVTDGPGNPAVTSTSFTVRAGFARVVASPLFWPLVVAVGALGFGLYLRHRRRRAS